MGYEPVSAVEVVRLIEQTAISSMVTKAHKTEMSTATEFVRQCR